MPLKIMVLMSRIENDGFEKLKGRRVEISGSQLPMTEKAFKNFLKGKNISTDNSISISASNIFEGNEWSPQQWLPQPIETEDKLKKYEDNVRFSIYRAVTAIPDLADVALEDFTEEWAELPDYPTGKTEAISYFFDVQNGKSSGEKNYIEGGAPYISSGDLSNSIIRLVDSEENETFPAGAITVTAFGQAYVQPWPFMARG